MLPSWLVIAVLVAANALYVAAEFAAVAAQRGRLAQLAEQGHRRARRLLAVLEDGAQLDRYIAGCQIGITISSLLLGAYTQVTISPKLALLLTRWWELSPESAYSTAAVVVLVVMSAIQVVLGELVPKSVALQFPEQAALATFVPTRWSVSLFRGFIWLLNGSGFLMLRPFGVKPGGHQHVHSPDEISILIAESHRGGALSPEASLRLQRGLRLSTRRVRDLMIPRAEIFGLEVGTPPAEILRRIIESPYSRVVVYRESLANVLGAVGTKDVVGAYVDHGDAKPLAELVRPLPFVLDSLRADQLVRSLQEKQSSKAIVVDEHGQVQGFVSIEDVLGELFGEIGDELKDAESADEPRQEPPR